MRVDLVIHNERETISNLIRALDNRLTVQENMAPEGEEGQVLVSNGPNTPPTYQSLQAAVEEILREHGLIP